MRRSFGWAEKEREQTRQTVVRYANRSWNWIDGGESKTPSVRHHKGSACRKQRRKVQNGESRITRVSGSVEGSKVKGMGVMGEDDQDAEAGVRTSRAVHSER